MKMVPIRGNTYHVRDDLKKLGGRWDAGDRVWMVPEGEYQQAQALVAASPAPERMERGRAVQTKRCWECGRPATRTECERNFGDWNESVPGAGECYCGC